MQGRTKMLIAAAALVALMAVAGCSAASNQGKNAGTTPTNGASASASATSGGTGASATSASDSDGDGIPNEAEALLGTDPQNADTDGDGVNDKADKDPLKADNPISDPSTTAGFKIDTLLAENNVDAAGAGAPDHLELTVTNTAKTDITSGWDLYYSLTDAKTNDVQSFYMKLPGFTLKAGETKHLHVDTTGAQGHFRADPNSSFYTGKNQLVIQAMLHAQGYAPQTATVKKDAAGAEAGGD